MTDTLQTQIQLLKREVGHLTNSNTVLTEENTELRKMLSENNEFFHQQMAFLKEHNIKLSKGATH